jgi:15-cis-phytoene synthase
VTVTGQTLADDNATAVEAARAGSGAGRHASVADGSTFAPGLEMLPAGIRGDVEQLYRVLRSLDDLVDDGDPRAAARVQALEEWASGGRAHSPEAQGMADLCLRHPLPRDQVLTFCAGMRHDLQGHTVETEEDFRRYCQQAGGAVGIMLVSILGVAGDDQVRRVAQARMATLGRAMQVTNILRDIDEDLAHGRLYISREMIERHGFPKPGRRGALLREQIAHADALYEQGAAAIPLLASGQAAMALSATLYREILRQIEAEGFGAKPGRVLVPVRRRRALIAEHGG